MFLADETIDAILVAFSGSVGLAVVSCARAIAAQLKRPDFRVDWMSVSRQVEAANAYEQMAEDKAVQWGVGGTTSTVVFTERRDAYWPADSES
jgi:hypothetical protein